MPFMYNKFLRKIIMKSGLKTIKKWVLINFTNFVKVIIQNEERMKKQKIAYNSLLLTHNA
jgi:hypothetical protein